MHIYSDRKKNEPIKTNPIIIQLQRFICKHHQRSSTTLKSIIKNRHTFRIYIYIDLLVLVPVALLILKHGKINKGTRSPAVSATYNKPGLPGLGQEAC